MRQLSWFFDLVIIGGYLAVAFVLGSALMVLAPLALAALVVVVVMIQERFSE